jgi:hypothetical protein
MSITHMQQYSDFSFEELRVQDHEAGRKKLPGAPTSAPPLFTVTATVQPGAFGVPGTLVCIVYVCVFCKHFSKSHCKVLFTRHT